MNNITINWKHGHTIFHEQNNILDTKRWAREEIAAMIRYVRDPMERVLVLASSGVRLRGPGPEMARSDAHILSPAVSSTWLSRTEGLH